MKFTKYLMSLAAVVGLVSACTKVDEVRTYDIGDVTAPVMHEIADEIVITSENQDETVAFTWDAADFGYRAVIEYTILASYDGGEPLSMFSKINTTSYEVNKEVLNARMALAVEDGGLGLPVGVASAVNFYVSATIGTGYASVLSDPVATSVTPTAAEKVYPSIWVMGGYSSWSYDAAQLLYNFSKDDTVYEGVVDFGGKAADGFKFSGALDWGDDNMNWGLDGDAEAPEAEAASIVLISAGSSGNITCYSKRFYKFSFDKNTLVLTKLNGFDKLGIVGDATPGGWDTDTQMEFNSAKRRFWVDVDLTAGEFKFRCDGTYDQNWGSDNSDGVLTAGGGNIKVAEAGKVRVYAYLSDSNDLRYELNAKAYGTDENGSDEPGPGPEPEYDWYIHGQTVATPDWGRTPMVKDAAPGAYKAAGVEVEAGSQFLFTDGGDAWIGADASLQNATLGTDGVFQCTVGEAFATSTDKVNVVIEQAGTYDVWFFPNESKAYVMNEGETPGDLPEPLPETWGIVGTITGWVDGSDLSMSDVSDGLFVRKGISLTTDDGFKIRFNNKWDDTKNYGLEGGNGVVDPDTAVPVITAGNSGNIGVSAAGTYDIYFNLNEAKVYVMTQGKTPDQATDPDPGPGPDPTDDVWGIVGSLTDWDNDLVLASEGGYLVRKGVSFAENDEFKLRMNGSWNTNYGVNDTAPLAINSGALLHLNSSNNIKLEQAGTYDVYFDLAGTTLYVMEQGKTPVPVEKPDWYVYGNLDTASTSSPWTELAGMTGSAEAGYKATLTFTANGQFLFHDGNNDNWTGAAETNSTVGTDQVYLFTAGAAIASKTGDPKYNIVIDRAGTYDVWYFPTQSKIFVMSEGETPVL